MKLVFSDTLDVIRYRKDHVKIIDFGPYVPATTKTLLFTKEELAGLIDDPPEFRFIGENIAIQPNVAGHFCMPTEINEFYETSNALSAMDIIQRVSFGCIVFTAVFLISQISYLTLVAYASSIH